MGRPGQNYFELVAPKQSEHELQLNCTQMLHSILRPDVAWTAIDHAHSFNPTIGRSGRPIGLLEAAKRKARGVKAGIPDYLFWHRTLGFAIELKVADGTLSTDQKDNLRQMIKAGIPIKICWTIDQVFGTVTDWDLVRPGVRLAA